MKYYVQDAEAGNRIDEFDTFDEAKAAIAEYEAIDKKDGTYTPDFYEVADENHCRIEE